MERSVIMTPMSRFNFKHTFTAYMHTINVPFSAIVVHTAEFSLLSRELMVAIRIWQVNVVVCCRKCFVLLHCLMYFQFATLIESLVTSGIWTRECLLGRDARPIAFGCGVFGWHHEYSNRTLGAATLLNKGTSV